MRTVRLGGSGPRVSRVTLGTAQLGGGWGPFDASAACDAMRYAWDIGITTFDTAQAYGESEGLLGKALRQPLRAQRERVVISAKGAIAPGTDRPRRGDAKFIRDGVYQSLRNLGVDYIDLYQIHWPDHSVPPEQTAETLMSLIDDGLVRYVGVSNYSGAELERLLASIALEAVQVPYHLFNRSIETEILPLTRRHGVGVLAYSALAGGTLTGRLTADTTFPPDDWRSRSAFFSHDSLKVNVAVLERLRGIAYSLGISLPQLAISWVLAQPGVHTAIVGSLTKRNINDAAGAADFYLSEDVAAMVHSAVADAIPLDVVTPEDAAHLFRIYSAAGARPNLLLGLC